MPLIGALTVVGGLRTFVRLDGGRREHDGGGDGGDGGRYLWAFLSGSGIGGSGVVPVATVVAMFRWRVQRHEHH